MNCKGGAEFWERNSEGLRGVGGGASCAGKNGRGRCLSWERVVVGLGGWGY